jgi:hypothetical protein
VIGTVFFLWYRRAAAGDVRFGVLAGVAVALLFLARAEGALFGLALLALVRSPRTRRAGAAGSAVALLIGIAWLARDLALGTQSDVFGRSVLLVRYEDFFGAGSTSWPPLDQWLAPKPAALATNAVTFAFAFGLLLVPGLARVLWTRRDRADVRAFAALLVLVYLAESLVFTLHSTRGSYFHSLAAFVPFGVAVGVIGTGELLRTVTRARAAALGGVVAAVLVSGFALAEWDASFNVPYRERVAAVGAIPPGPFFAIDAAAWRWIADRPVIVTPVSPPCSIRGYGAASLVLEPAHFTAYRTVFDGGPRPDYLGEPTRIGGIAIYPIDPTRVIDCAPIR